MGRILAGDEQAILKTPDFTVHGRLVVEGVPLESVLDANPLEQATVVQDVTDYIQGGTFVCALGRGSQSLSPYLSTGLQISGQPALVEDRAIKWQVQCSPPGAPASGSWRTVFDGAIDTVEVAPQTNQVTIHCRDRMSHLVITQIENITDVGGQPQWGFPVTGGLVQDMVQSILDTAWTYAYGVPYPNSFFVVGGPPTDSAIDYWQERTSLMEAIRALGVGKNGWDLRGRWDQAGEDSFTLCYYKPDREGDPTITVIPIQPTAGGAWYRYLGIRRLSRDRLSIRNVAEVTPADVARVPVVTVNTASVDRVGRMFEAVSEDKASHIDTAGEAGVLGGLIVNDLGFAKSSIELELPFNWTFEINDLFQPFADAAGAYYDREDLIYGATRIELHYANGAGSTILTGRQGGGAADMGGWLKQDEQYTPKRVYARTDSPVGPGRENAIWLQYAP